MTNDNTVNISDLWIVHFVTKAGFRPTGMEIGFLPWGFLGKMEAVDSYSYSLETIFFVPSSTD